MRNIKKMIVVGFTLGMLTASTTVFANTREFIFHMDQSYLHGTNNYNTGYVASKFERSNNAIVSMWVSPAGRASTELTDPWSWQSTQPRKRLQYAVQRKKGDTHQLSAEQFRSGPAVLSGKWTP